MEVEVDGAAPAALPPRATLLPRVRAHLGAAPGVLWLRVALGLFALAVLAAGVETALDLAAGTPHLGLLATANGRIVLLDPDGAAARAGLKVGDTIAAIGGVTLPGRGFSLLAQAPGDTITVEEGRPDQFVSLTVRLVAPSTTELAGDVAALVAALALWLSGLAGLPRRRDGGARLYALAAFALALALCALVARDGNAFWPWPVLAPAALVGVTALLLSGVVPVLSGAWGRVIVAAVIVVAGLPALVAALDAFQPFPVPVAAWVAGTLAVLAVAAMIGPLLAHAVARAEPARRRLRVALLAATLGLLPLCMWPGLDVVAALTGRVLTLPGGEAHVSPQWATLGLVALAVLYGALFLSRDTRRLDAYAHTGLSYAIPLALGVGVLLALATLLPAPGLLAAVAVALVLFPLAQRAVGRMLERAAWQPQPDYAVALRLVEELAATMTDSGRLASAAVTRLPAALRVRAVALVVQGLDCPADRYRLIGADAQGQGLARDDVLVPEALPAELLDAARPVAPYPVRLPVRAAHILGSLDVALWAPLWWDGAQRGALVLGPRLSGDPFDSSDLRGVAGLSGVLALALHTLDLIAHLRERTSTLATLTHRLSHAHEQERAHLSRELHDVVAQELIALTRQLRRYGDSGAPPPAIWADMLAAAQDALTATRRICNGLRPAILDLGLVPALRDLVAEADERAGAAEVSLSVDGLEQRLPTELEFALFRVAQEGLSNALAHAHARQVRVEVAFNSGVLLRVRDDGHGFVVPPRFEDLPGDHLGLIGMRERLAEFNGTLTITSTPGRGTVLEACVRSQ